MKRIAYSLATLAVVAMAVVHYPLLYRHGGGGHCPFGYDRAPARISSPVPAGRAASLGLPLGTASRADARAWAVSRGAQCRDQRGTLLCEHARVDGLDTTAWFDLDGNGHVAALHAVRRASRPAAITAAFATATRAVARTAVPVAADGSLATLDLGLLRQAAVRYRGDHYRAELRATNMGDGYALTELYAAD